MNLMALTLPLVTVEGCYPNISSQDLNGHYIVFVKNRNNSDFYIANRKHLSSIKIQSKAEQPCHPEE